MARISTYPVSSPSPDDLIVGTDVITGNPTKNFTVGSIISTTIPDYINGTQDTIPIFTTSNTIGDSLLKQELDSNGLYTMKFTEANNFVLDKPNSSTSGDPAFEVRQNNTAKVSFGWDDDGGGFGFLYNWSGDGWRFGAAGNNPELEIITTSGNEGLKITNKLEVGGEALFDSAVLFDGDIRLESGLVDGQGNFGAQGQLLSSTGFQNVEWIDAPQSEASGTAGTLAIFTSTTALGDSLISQNLAGVIISSDVVDIAQPRDNTFAGSSGAGNLFGSTAGNRNTGFGYGTQSKGSGSASANTSVGWNSLKEITVGNQNVAIGNSALQENLSGSFNIAVGPRSLSNTTLGQQNTAIGYEALLNSTGNFNVAIGNGSLKNTTTGFRNVAVGATTGSLLTTGRQCVIIGDEAELKNPEDQNSIVIGAQSIGAGDNSTVIGNSNTTETTIFGDLRVLDSAIISTDLTVEGDAVIDGDLDIGSVYKLAASNSSKLVAGGPSDGSIQIGQFGNLYWGDPTNTDSLRIQNTLSGSEIKQKGSGSLQILCENEVSIFGGVGFAAESLAKFTKDGPIELYFDNDKKFATTSYGVDLPEDLSLAGKFIDSNDSPGTAGQVLSSTATGTEWVAASSGGLTGNVTLGQIPFGNSTSGGVLVGSNDFTINTTGGGNGKPIIGVGVDVTAGSHSPVGAVEVNSFINYGGAPFDYYIQGLPNGQFQTFTGTDVFAISYYGTGRFMGQGVHVFSDERIKKDISVSNSAEDLQTISNIEISNYKYIDPVKGGEEKKVIAQQVEQHYPSAVKKGTDCLPDIFQQGKIKDGVIDFVFECEVGDKIKILRNQASYEIVEILEINEDGIKVDTDFEGDVFVYGKQVDDYCTVDYDALSMLNISATQELYKIINELKQEIQALKEQA